MPPQKIKPKSQDRIACSLCSGKISATTKIIIELIPPMPSAKVRQRLISAGASKFVFLNIYLLAPPFVLAFGDAAGLDAGDWFVFAAFAPCIEVIIEFSFGFWLSCKVRIYATIAQRSAAGICDA